MPEDAFRSEALTLLESHAADCTGTKSKRQAVGAVLASSPLQFKGNCGKRWKQVGVHDVLTLNWSMMVNVKLSVLFAQTF